MAVRSPRGRYAKSDAKRAEILQVALQAYASSARQEPPLRSIAAAVGLSEAGVLHHFSSKDDLRVAILETSDDVNAQRHDLTTVDGVLELLAETTRTPGLTKLFVDMTAASADPKHPAAAFMDRHRIRAEHRLGDLLGPGKMWQARVLVAAAEGLQIQWMRDPSVDIVGDLRKLIAVLQDS